MSRRPRKTPEPEASAGSAGRTKATASPRPGDSPRPTEPPRPSERPDCLCMGLGPELTHFLRGLASSGEMRTAVVEVLKALRTLADAQIEYLSRQADRKGTKVEVE